MKSRLLTAQYRLPVSMQVNLVCGNTGQSYSMFRLRETKHSNWGEMAKFAETGKTEVETRARVKLVL